MRVRRSPYARPVVTYARPRLTPAEEERAIAKMRRDGFAAEAIAKELGIPIGRVTRLFRIWRRSNG